VIYIKNSDIIHMTAAFFVDYTQYISYFRI